MENNRLMELDSEEQDSSSPIVSRLLYELRTHGPNNLNAANGETVLCHIPDRTGELAVSVKKEVP